MSIRLQADTMERTVDTPMRPRHWAQTCPSEDIARA